MYFTLSNIVTSEADLGVRHVGFQNGLHRQANVGYIFVSELTTNVILVAKQIVFTTTRFSKIS